MREFKDSTATHFRFSEITTRNVWRGGSSKGFSYGGVAAHGSIAMVVWEGDRYERGVEEWASGIWTLGD